MPPRCSLLVDSSLDFWLTTGRFAAQFEKRVRPLYRECASATLVNSGSSANLLALSALTSPKLGDRRLRPGDEVITVAAGFPTTVNPIIQNGLVPVFVDVTMPTYNVDVTQLEAGPFAAHARRHAGPHARQSVRPGRGDGVRRSTRPVADRRLLRRGRVARTTAARSARSATWRPSASIRPTTSRWAKADAC